MNIQLDHIAILTRSLERTEKLLPQAFVRHEIEVQPAEGTIEQYINLPNEGYPSLLLMEATEDGPYKKSLHKRGAGLHHLGCVTSDIDDAIHYFSKCGLLLHPISLRTYSHRVVWLCRPGIPFLLELYQNETFSGQHSNNIQLALPSSTMQGNAIEFIPGLTIHRSIDDEMRMMLNEQSIPINLSSAQGSSPEASGASNL